MFNPRAVASMVTTRQLADFNPEPFDRRRLVQQTFQTAETAADDVPGSINLLSRPISALLPLSGARRISSDATPFPAYTDPGGNVGGLQKLVNDKRGKDMSAKAAKKAKKAGRKGRGGKIAAVATGLLEGYAAYQATRTAQRAGGLIPGSGEAPSFESPYANPWYARTPPYVPGGDESDSPRFDFGASVQSVPTWVWLALAALLLVLLIRRGR